MSRRRSRSRSSSTRPPRPPPRSSTPAPRGRAAPMTVRSGSAWPATDATSGLAKLEYQVNTVGAFKAFGVPQPGGERGARVGRLQPANKPVFSAPGHYTVLPRDGRGRQRRDGEVGVRSRSAPAARTRTAGHHRRARPGAAGPGQSIRRRSTSTSRRSIRPPAGPASNTVGAQRVRQLAGSPARSTSPPGDTVRWDFPGADGQPHDVWTSAGRRHGAGRHRPRAGHHQHRNSRAGPSVTKALTETGAWTFLASLPRRTSAGAWNGMVGDAVVAAGQATQPGVGESA